MARYLNPRSDVVFKKIFAEHEHLLVILLNSASGLSEADIIKLEKDLS